MFYKQTFPVVSGHWTTMWSAELIKYPDHFSFKRVKIAKNLIACVSLLMPLVLDHVDNSWDIFERTVVKNVSMCLRETC